MKKLHMAKNVKITKYKHVKAGDKLVDGYTVNVVCCEENGTQSILLEHKKSKSHLYLEHITPQGKCSFVGFSPKGVTNGDGDIAVYGMKVKNNFICVGVESYDSQISPVEVGDEIYYPNGGYKITVDFVANDGSIVAWDSIKNRSYYINRNDRDQLKALNLVLRNVDENSSQ